MAGVFKYMIDDNGEKTSVVVPIKTWQKLNESYSRLQKKLDVLIGIKRAITEIKEAGTPAKNYNL